MLIYSPNPYYICRVSLESWLLSTGPVVTNFSEIVIKILKFLFMQMDFKMSAVEGGHFVSAPTSSRMNVHLNGDIVKSDEAFECCDIGHPS